MVRHWVLIPAFIGSSPVRSVLKMEVNHVDFKTVITTFDALAILTFFLLGRDNSNEKDAVAVWGSLIALFLVNIFAIWR